MPQLKITNLSIKDGFTKKDIIKFIRTYGDFITDKIKVSNELGISDALKIWNEMKNNGIYIPVPLKEKFSSIFNFDSKVIETDMEKVIRLKEEIEEKIRTDAWKWYYTLTIEQQNYTRYLWKLN